jgi:valyl-tRNA synthetase
MDKNYTPSDIEHKWYEQWEQSGSFKPEGKESPYCIMLPPPNVTGSLHMGHGFQHTLMDALTRFHRMQGQATLWQPGTDHAGISTQMVVERQLEAKGQKRTDFQRDDFVNKIWEWKKQSGGQISQQIRRLGASVDWSKERFTMDQGLSNAVMKVFIQLFDEGLIYRGKRLVNWDCKLKTAISDLEVISSEEKGSLWHLRYPLKDSKEHIIIATTRPETLLGDTAIAVHPDDSRYQHLIGKEALVPYADRAIPIVADEYVDKEFGSGCVKITPAHDFNDYELGLRHELPMVNILEKDGTLNHNAPSDFQGLSVDDARKLILEKLSADELIEKIDEHTLKVPRGEKSNAIIEPLLTEQWYVKAEPLAKPALEAVRNGKIKFVPENWTKTYYQWLENIEDWCISRQLWWGHRIPAWYDKEGKVYVGYSEKDVRFKHRLEDDFELTQDTDVLDTWFSSALWPFSTLGWPENTENLKTFYPTSVLVTGFDIIFFWVARMVMMGLKFTGKIPFHEVYITGLIRDGEGHKMSKSKGNVIDPIDLIDGISLDDLLEKRTQNLMLGSAKDKIIKHTKKEFPEGIPAFGTDALRFTYAALATTGRDIRFSLNRIEGYRNFCNKIWNAARYVISNVENSAVDFDDGAFQYSAADQWILSRLQKVIQEVETNFKNYRFDLLCQTLYDFIWREYCDWYLELSKPVLYDKDALVALKRGTRRTLIKVLEQIVTLIHPIMPFISEEIWSRLKHLCSDQSTLLISKRYPKVDETLLNDEMEEEIGFMQRTIQGIRTIRSELNVSPKVEICLYVKSSNDNHRALLSTHQTLLFSLAKVNAIHWVKNEDTPPPSATTVIDELECFVALEGLIDIESECKRLNKELEKLSKDIARFEGKLNNDNFIAKAPEAVIAEQKEKLQTAIETKEKLSAQQEVILSLQK